ncbi:class I SAM-dependent methyltransferase [Desulfonema ishimotonii]|uniref:Class I SAM-dependent methyltransferase n=1 Tax=Desulfonema ishimotonii TaxID=45657 RepID=A0A401G3V6_9BACT|nr:methyltransferase domain-containing protein [Desulfonema ishimotonii]GBC63883.1 class I SAM-dependent methyltransferase [Desulfonema ishimotonii]
MGSDFYSEHAARLAAQYEGLAPEKIHAGWRRFIPPPKAVILDVGAGSGRDAVWLAGMGHEVFAAEPADGLRAEGMRRHPQSPVRWISDELPELARVRRIKAGFDLILLSAVWMHLPQPARCPALETLAGLLNPGGHVVIILRCGASPDAREMYPVSAPELGRMAVCVGLETVLAARPEPDGFNRAGVSWETVVLGNR